LAGVVRGATRPKGCPVLAIIVNYETIDLSIGKGVIIMIVGLVLAWLYIGALFSSPVVTLLATIAVILVLLLINAASV
jgi:hypothetical protein